MISSMSLDAIRKTPKYIADISTTKNNVIKADLSANENALGPSANALAAFRASADDLWRYPDGSHRLLREAIGEYYGLDAAQIACGAGSDELITLLTRMFAGPEDEVLYSEYGFVMYPINAIRLGAKPVKAPAQGLGTNVKAVIESITDKTRIIFIANPNNPTGTYLTGEQIRYLAANTPANVILVIDSAYAEYVEKVDYEDAIALVEQYPNVVMLRTFSKLYALASLRVGWCYAAAELIDLIERSRNPYNVNGPAQAAAIAALQDIEHVRRSRQHNTEWLEKITQEMQKIKIEVKPSVCNFVLADFQSPQNAVRAYEFLLQHGIFTRPMNGYDLPSYLRITVGRVQDNEYLLDILKQF